MNLGTGIELNSPGRGIVHAGAIDRAAAVAVLGVISAVHVPVAVSHLREVRYLGLLFAAFAVGTAALAASIAIADHTISWRLSLATGVGALTAYAMSRAFGLPLAGDDRGDWTNHAGYVAAAAEVALVLLALRNLSVRNHNHLKGNQK